MWIQSILVFYAFFCRACLRRSTAHSHQGCRLVGPGGSYFLMKLENPTNSEYSGTIQWVLTRVYNIVVTIDLCGFSKRVGVFCCAPKGISRTLHRLCNSPQYSGTTFEFNKESFSWLNFRAGSTLSGHISRSHLLWGGWLLIQSWEKFLVKF